MNYAKISELGVLSWKLNADIYETDEELKKIRRDRNYSYMVRFFNLCGRTLLILLHGQEHVQMLMKFGLKLIFPGFFFFPSTSSVSSMDLSLSAVIL